MPHSALEMMQVRGVALWRGYVRTLRTEKERVGFAERVVRALLMVVPYYLVDSLLYVRAALWRPLAVDGTTEDGVQIKCQLPDIIQRYVFLFGTWEPDLTAFMRRRLRPGDTFIDIGANIGYNSVLASRLVGANGEVVAFEPAPAVRAAMEATVATNNLTNVRLVAAAVSDREAEISLYAGSSYRSGFTTTGGRRLGLKEQGRVRAAPLGALVTPAELATARMIKIDVEGAEESVLAGMVASLDALPADAEIVVEVMPQWWSDKKLRPIDVLQPFLDRGFHVYLLPASYWPWRYLWPNDVGAARRLRDLAVLERRARLDVVLSHSDADEL